MSFKPKGIIPPLVTPFNSDKTINYEVYKQVIDHVIDGGCHGVFPFGTTGEFYAISNDEYYKALCFVVEYVNGRVPVYAGTNHITTSGTIELIQIAKKAKVDAVSVLTPMFVSQTQDELYNFFKTVAESTDLPIIMYNNKPKTNVTIEPATVAKLAKIPNIIGVKDSTGDMTNSLEYIRLTKDCDNFSVLLGRDTLILAGLHHGAVGAVASCANIAPKVVVDIYENFVSGDMDNALKAQFDLAPIRIACGMGTFPAVIKEGLVMQGIEVGKCLEPIAELSIEQKNKLREILSKIDSIKLV